MKLILLWWSSKGADYSYCPLFPQSRVVQTSPVIEPWFRDRPATAARAGLDEELDPIGPAPARVGCGNSDAVAGPIGGSSGGKFRGSRVHAQSLPKWAEVKAR